MNRYKEHPAITNLKKMTANHFVEMNEEQIRSYIAWCYGWLASTTETDHDPCGVGRDMLKDNMKQPNRYELCGELTFEENEATCRFDSALVLADLSAEAKFKRKPLPPEALVDARHERIHRDPGRARAARTVRRYPIVDGLFIGFGIGVITMWLLAEILIL